MKFKEYLKEMAFDVGKDVDYVHGPIILTLSEKLNYQVKGKTHGAESHAIKHFSEFKPGFVIQTVNRAKSKLKNHIPLIHLYHRNKGLIATGKEAYDKMTDDSILNFFDLLNDKLQTGIKLTDEEKLYERFVHELGKKYQKEIDKRLSKTININSMKKEDIIKHIQNNEMIEFKAQYRNMKGSYVLDLEKGILIAFLNGKLKSMFKFYGDPVGIEAVRALMNKDVITVPNKTIWNAFIEVVT